MGEGELRVFLLHHLGNSLRLTFKLKYIYIYESTDNPLASLFSHSFDLLKRTKN